MAKKTKKKNILSRDYCLTVFPDCPETLHWPVFSPRQASDTAYHNWSAVNSRYKTLSGNSSDLKADFICCTQLAAASSLLRSYLGETFCREWLKSIKRWSSPLSFARLFPVRLGRSSYVDVYPCVFARNVGVVVVEVSHVSLEEYKGKAIAKVIALLLM